MKRCLSFAIIRMILLLMIPYSVHSEEQSETREERLLETGGQVRIRFDATNYQF